MSQIPTMPTGEKGHKRRTPLSARGEPAVWLTGGALIVSLALILSVLVVIVIRGSATFIPKSIERVTLAESGEIFFGQPLESERYRPTESERATIAATSPEAIDEAGLVERVRFRVGNRDLGQDSTRWVPSYAMKSRDIAEDALLLERRSWGVFLGEYEAIQILPESEGEIRVETGRESFEKRLADAQRRVDRLDAILNGRLPSVEERLTSLKWEVRKAERTLEAAEIARASGEGSPPPLWLWLILVGAPIISACSLAFSSIARNHSLVRVLLILVAAGSGLAAVLEHPWSGPSMTAEQLEAIKERVASERSLLEAKKATLEAEITELRRENQRYRVVVRDPLTGSFAPASRDRLGEALPLSQITRVVRPNELGTLGRFGVYLGRWWSFLSERPGEAPGDGGVFPVIVGTVTLTLLLTIGVVPLGVIAAVYLREYAKQGPFTSAIRIAINNLAGVPSIVYGMFGLGFFCYAVGGWIDAGPEVPAARAPWWMLFAAMAVALGIAWSVGTMLAKPAAVEGSPVTRAVGRWVSVVLWLSAIGLAGYLIATTPYFNGFFSERLPEQPTFGGRGVLWASLTLALLTLPVVVVATEEAIAAVPRSMREGSFGCGASRWQTVRLIVLPAAMPGIMTGTILAMARGAGEVAPLMLVGAVNFTKDLPLTTSWPFIHGERTFMHLGFHIYNLGFQSPDSEATEPLVWTTTLLLVAIVLVLNLAAVIIRARLRKNSGAAI